MQCPLFLAGHWWQHYCVKQHQLLNREPRTLLVLVLRVLVMPRDLFFFYYMESINWIIYFFFFSYFFLLFSQIFVPSLGKQGLLAPHVVFLTHNSAFPSLFYPFCFASLFHDYCSPMHHKPYLVHLGEDKASEKWVSKSQSPIDLRSQTLFLYIKEGLPKVTQLPTGRARQNWDPSGLMKSQVPGELQKISEGTLPGCLWQGHRQSEALPYAEATGRERFPSLQPSNFHPNSMAFGRRYSSNQQKFWSTKNTRNSLLTL